MSFTEDEDLVEVPNDFMGEGIEDLGSDEDRSRVSETEEESHDVTKDPVRQRLDSWVPGKKL